MHQELVSEIKNIFQSFQESLQLHLPALEKETQDLIAKKSLNIQEIEYQLDVLLSLTMLGVGDKLFVQLLDYYKTIDAEGALFYWNEYDKEEEEDEDEF